MNTISFSYNWNNKLNCTIYTTLRLTNKHQPGDVVRVELNKQPIHNAQVLAIKRIKLADINDYIAGIDTGYDAEKCKDILKTMYKNKGVDWDKQLISFILLKQKR
jgi:hypothetical protein